jgi:hypothetical protein
MNRTKMIDHKGRKIFFIDFSNLQSIDEIGLVAQEIRKYVHVQPTHSVYSLTTIEGMHFNNSIKDVFTELANSNKPYVKAAAIVGVSGMKQILYNGIMKLSGREVKVFSSIELAKDWLASHD